MNKNGVFMIRTALTTKLQLELTYREHCSESATANGGDVSTDLDSVNLSDSGDPERFGTACALSKAGDLR
jgi:hypothetical protein